MNRKLLAIIITVCSVYFCAFAVAVCLLAVYITNTCKSGAIPHKYVNGVCSTCGEELSISEGLEYTLNEDNESYSVNGIGTCTDTKLNIPGEYKGKPVTSIGDAAFRGCTGLTYISIHDGITGICESAFKDCSALKSMTIPDSVSLIGGESFRGCRKLTNINIPYGVTEISNNEFEDCVSLKNITIPDSITKIGWSAFSGCSALTSIKIPDGVTVISGYAFYNCSALMSINIPDGVTHIDDRAFYGCSNLKSISIPDSVTFIGELAFKSCSNLKTITIPDSVTHVGEGLFYGCTNLTTVQLSSQITSLPSYDDYIYSSAGGLIFGIEHRYEGFFENCEKLKSITFQGTKGQWNAIDKGRYWNSNTGNYTVICTDGEINKTKN